MGRSYWFECEKCGYRARVSGRLDRGLNLLVQTITCRDCRELYDAVIQVRAPDGKAAPTAWKRPGPGRPAAVRMKRPPPFASALDQLKSKGARPHRWLRFAPQCPHSSLHQVRPWTDPGACPKCGVFMERSGAPYRLWE